MRVQYEKNTSTIYIEEVQVHVAVTHRGEYA